MDKKKHAHHRNVVTTPVCMDLCDVCLIRSGVRMGVLSQTALYRCKRRVSKIDKNHVNTTIESC